MTRLLALALAAVTTATAAQAQTISEPGCTGNLNATGVPGQIEVTGNIDMSANTAILRAYDLPPNQFGIFLCGLSPLAPGTINSGNGTLCINPGAQGGLGRFDAPQQIRSTGPTGEMSLDSTTGAWITNVIPTSVGDLTLTGGTVYYQAWHREPVGAGFNFTGSCVVNWQ